MGYPVMCLEYCIYLAGVRHFWDHDALAVEKRHEGEVPASHGVLRASEEQWAFNGEKENVVSDVSLV
jgi:hypothetical protein